MFTIPLYISLFLYLLFFALFLVFMAVNLYHIVGSGSATLASFFITFLLLMSTVFILYGTWFLIQGIDWQQPLLVIRQGMFGSWFSF